MMSGRLLITVGCCSRFCPGGILHHPSKNDIGFIRKGIAPEGATYALPVTAFRRSTSRTRLASRVTQSINKQGRLKKREVIRLHSSRDEKSVSECVEYLMPDHYCCCSLQARRCAGDAQRLVAGYATGAIRCLGELVRHSLLMMLLYNVFQK